MPLAYEFQLRKRATVPQNNPSIRSTGCSIAIWRRLPLPVANALGSFHRAQSWLMPTTMEPLLFLVHRFPSPPNKGDKVRSFHLLEFLASRYRVHLGTFVDSPDDVVHVDRLRVLRIQQAGGNSARVRPRSAASSASGPVSH